MEEINTYSAEKDREHFLIRSGDRDLSKRRQRDNDVSMIFEFKTNKEISAICRGALADEKNKKLVGAGKPLLTWKKLMLTKLINKNQ